MNHEAVKSILCEQKIELPSWAFGSGTRFKVFTPPDVQRGPREKTADAAQVHRYAGAVSVALYVPSAG
jgi:L-rhamnose isomerase